MKVVVFAILCFSATYAASIRKDEAEDCSSSLCKLEQGCACVSGISPIATENTPQFVLMSFDDAITKHLYDGYLSTLLDGRKNPDGSTIKGTFFVPHEYSDYESVHDLYAAGHEIGVHSISKNALTEYWKNASKETLVDEFYGQKQIISYFANIPEASIVGVRTPHFQLNGDTSFAAYERGRFDYDCSWPTPSSDASFPFSLHYKSNQQCLIGTCPSESHDIWVSPINNIKGNDDVECNVLYSCNYDGTKAEVQNWLMAQFNRSYYGNRTPVNLLISSSWFGNVDASFDALYDLIDDLLTKKDVFFVTHSQLIDWRKNPVPVSEYVSENPVRNHYCIPVTCPLLKGEETRYMKSCVNCPVVYPWLGNPLGRLQL